MTLPEKSEKDNNQSKRKSGSAVNDRPGSLLAVVRFREALDRTEMPATAQKIGGFIVRKFNVEEGYAWPTIARIAFECSCSEATVYRAFQEKDGPLREWFKVGKTVINGEERNTYTPDWVKADAVNREFEIRLKEWQKDHAETSQNERSRPRKMRGDDLSKCEAIEVRVQNLSDRASLHTRSDERVETRSGSRKGRPPGSLAGDYLASIDFSECILELEKNLPPFEPFDGFKPVDQERSRRGAIYQMRKLSHLGWSLDEIREYLDVYRRDFDEQAKTNFKRNGQCGKTLASLLSQLVDQCNPATRNTDDGEIYGWHIPERFLRKPDGQPELDAQSQLTKEDLPKTGAANDNDEETKRPPLRYGTYGGECDPDDPF